MIIHSNQISILVTSDSNNYARKLLKQLCSKDLRANIDLRNEKISYKIREHSIAKVPIIMIVGKKEVDQNTISIRRLGSDKTESLKLKEAILSIQKETSSPN